MTKVFVEWVQVPVRAVLTANDAAVIEQRLAQFAADMVHDLNPNGERVCEECGRNMRIRDHADDCSWRRQLGR